FLHHLCLFLSNCHHLPFPCHVTNLPAPILGHTSKWLKDGSIWVFLLVGSAFGVLVAIFTHSKLLTKYSRSCKNSSEGRPINIGAIKGVRHQVRTTLLYRSPVPR
ncbi:nucleoside diphosphatase gda1, partial [Moniliophthora roreri]